LIPPGLEVTDPAPFVTTVRVVEGRGDSKTAVALVSVVSVSVQVVAIVPAQSSCQPPKRWVGDGVAVKAIVVPQGYVGRHGAPAHVTVPDPVPAKAMVRVGLLEPGTKFAVAVLAVVRVNVQLEPEPAQTPPQPSKVLSGSGVASSVTVVPAGAEKLQGPPVPQAMPAGVTEVTLPVPAFVTCKVVVAGVAEFCVVGDEVAGVELSEPAIQAFRRRTAQQMTTR
jgi:hypothetical protein